MEQFSPALAHGHLEPVFQDIFFVTGAMETVLQDLDWCFSRNMTVVREGERLIVINTVRLDETGLAELERLGQVTDVIRLGALHGRDDSFYVDRYQARYWTLPGLANDNTLAVTHTLSEEGPLPISDASLFEFQTTRLPEGILHLKRDGGILIACDALQNWISDDEFFSDVSRDRMQEMGFFTPANLGPVWCQAAAPGGEDFLRLKTLNFKHALCGHGEPLRETAHEDYSATFNRLFGV